MSITSQPNSSAYQACLDEARQQAPLMAKRWYTALSEQLLEKSTAPLVVYEKQQIHDAWQALIKHQADIERGFAQQIAQAIDSKVGNSSASGTGRSNEPSGFAASSLKFDDLELMGDDQVQDTLDEARLVQTLLLVSEAGLTGLSARLSTAQGLKVVKSDKNPLRPEVYASALVQVLQDLPVVIEIRTRWLIYGGQIMGELLQTLYAALDKLLEKQGVKQAGYAVLTSPEEPKRLAAAPDRASDRRSASSDKGRAARYPGDNPGEHFSREQLLTLDHLHRLMSGDYDDSFVSEADSDLDTDVEFGLLPVKAQPGKAKRPPHSLGQSLAVEVVGLLIEQLTADQRLLPPVRQLIAGAEPAFLRLGAADPTFFSNKNHPARRLLEAVTAKSLAFASESDEGFAEFMQDLEVAAVRLTNDKAIGSLDFASLLKNFEDRQTARNQAVVESQKLAVKALMQAEQRYLLAEKIAAEICERRDFVAGNAIIATFVTGPWAQVMAHERLAMESNPSGKHKAVFSLALGDLMWSADVAQASRYRKRLVKIIPGMMDAVREGLLSIDYPLSLSKGFFDELMGLHEQALSAPPEKIEAVRKNSLTPGNSFFSTDVRNSRNPWLQSSEALQSGFMDFADTTEQAHEPVSNTRVIAASPVATATSNPVFVDLQDTRPLLSEEALDIQPGAWVDLVAGNQWVRARLIWISPHGTLFMFSSTGGRSHSMTARMLKHCVAQGRFKLVSQQGLLDGALDTVAQTAMRNSVQSRKPF